MVNLKTNQRVPFGNTAENWYRKITIFEYEEKSKPVRETDDFEMTPVEPFTIGDQGFSSSNKMFYSLYFQIKIPIEGKKKRKLLYDFECSSARQHCSHISHQNSCLKVSGNKLIKKIQQIGVDRILTRFILMFCINILPLFYHAIYTYRKFGVVFKVNIIVGFTIVKRKKKSRVT